MVGFEEAKEVIRARLALEGHHLSSIEEIAMKAAWARKTYAQVSSEEGVNLNTLQGTAAPYLWKKLSRTYDRKVTKTTFKEFCLKEFHKDRTDILTLDPSYQDKDYPTGQLNKFTIPVVGATLPLSEEFYGRQRELQELQTLVNRYSCVLIVGAEGIGKKTLVAQALSHLATQVSLIIWKPLYHKPTADELELELLQLLDTDGDLLISRLKTQKVLIVFESMDSIINRHTGPGELDPPLMNLFRRIVTETESKVICISNEPIEGVRSMMLRGNAMIYPLRGLGLPEAHALMGEEMEGYTERIWEATDGNPLLLKRIKDWRHTSGAGLSPEVAARFTVHQGLLNNLHSQLFNGHSLSTLDKQVLQYIASQKEGISFDQFLSTHPGAASNIQRLTEMGVVTKADLASEVFLRVGEFFRHYLQQEAKLSRA